jgi:hypothetical protein
MNISATTKYFFRIMSIHIESSKVRIFYSDRERSLGNTLVYVKEFPATICRNVLLYCLR